MKRCVTEGRILCILAKDRINLFGDLKISQDCLLTGTLIHTVYFHINFVCWWREANERWDETNLAANKNKFFSGEISHGFQVG